MLVVLNMCHLELVNGALSLEHNRDDNYSESVLEWAHLIASMLDLLKLIQQLPPLNTCSLEN